MRNCFDKLPCDIQRRHFNAMAHKCGLGTGMEDVVEAVLAQLDPVLDGLRSGCRQASPRMSSPRSPLACAPARADFRTKKGR